MKSMQQREETEEGEEGWKMCVSSEKTAARGTSI